MPYSQKKNYYFVNSACLFILSQKGQNMPNPTSPLVRKKINKLAYPPSPPVKKTNRNRLNNPSSSRWLTSMWTSSKGGLQREICHHKVPANRKLVITRSHRRHWSWKGACKWCWHKKEMREMREIGKLQKPNVEKLDHNYMKIHNKVILQIFS